MKIFDWLDKNKKNKFFTGTVLFLVFALGIFLRTYHHQDWLLFQSDQSRDAMIISRALDQGAEELPLLGPQARGSNLFLGPIFYYFGYAFAEVFGDQRQMSPWIFAWPDLVFSLAAIPLFFFLVRKYFAFWLSTGLTLLFSTSIFLVSYGRFAWNPNSMPFFMLLLALGLLNASEKNNKKKNLWLALAIIALAVVTQLHFVAFFLAPVLFVVFIALNHKFFSRGVLFSLLILIPVFYLPVIIHEHKTNYKNSRALLETFNKKTTKDSEKHDLDEKALRALQETSRYGWLAVSGDQKTVTLQTKRRGGLKLEMSCNEKCQKFRPHSLVALLFLVFGLMLLLRERKKESMNRDKKNFLSLMIIWSIAFLAIITPISYQSSPRFYLAFAPVALVMLGLIVKYLLEKIKNCKVAVATVIVLFLLLAASNLFEIHKYFGELSMAHSAKELPGRRDIIMPGGKTVTLQQLEAIVDFAEKLDWKNGKQSFALVAENHYARSIFYLLDRHSSVSVECYFKKSDFDSDYHQNYLYVVNSNSKKHLSEETLKNYDIISKKPVGTLTVYQLQPKNLQINDTIHSKCYVF